MRKTIVRTGIGFFVTAICLLVSGLAYAHHAHQATADYAKLVGVTGVVTRFNFTNPHITVYVQATNPDGTTEEWVGYGSSPAHEVRLGNGASMFKIGQDKITMYGFANRDGRKFMIWVRKVRESGADVPIYQTEVNDLLAFMKTKHVMSFNAIPESDKRYVGGKPFQAKNDFPNMTGTK
jgi:hypothetical protein